LDLRSKTVVKGEAICDWNAYSGPMPRRAYIFMTKSSALYGDIKENPQKFDFFNLQQYRVFANDEMLPCSTATPAGMKAYLETMFDADTFTLDPDQFTHGYGILCVQFNNVSKDGTVRIVLDFAKPLDENVSVLAMFEVDSVLEIDANRTPRVLPLKY
jgi:hypothetical protein